MLPPNPIREALSSGRFCYMVELVASRLTREAKIFEIGAKLAQVQGVVAGSITSYAGGALGHDPIRVGTAVRARGLTPNIHLTCVNRDRLDIRKSLEDLHALGIENVFAISGDYPKSGNTEAPADYDLDSVQLIEYIAEMREAGLPFHISCAVSPFKYVEADCAYQYLKLEKKIKAGADYAITQLGYDVQKFRELKRYLGERGLKTPVFGNVYVLAPKAAEKFSKGEPPGCWVSKELLEKIQAEAKAPDKGAAARLERAARTVAILRGLGYAGAYLGGDHQAERIQWIIRRSEEIAGKWEEYAEEMNYGLKGGFYFYQPSPPAPKKKPGFWVQVADVFEPANAPKPVRKVLTAVFRWMDKYPKLAQAFEGAELAFKKPVFGCQACGNCVLGLMEYTCPMTCPKSMRNGPCGGTLMGQCEVIPDKPCIWVSVYTRAKAADRVDDLRVYIPPRHRYLKGTSSYLNYFLRRDSRPENMEPLYQIATAPVAPAAEKDEALVKK